MTETSPETNRNSNEKILLRLIEDEMKVAYVNYAMSVIVGRALPDVRDGLKPVHRRILYAMHEMGLVHQKPFKKCARIVGEVLGKYHPHGDSSVYDALVRMAQEFSLRYPLISGQGNFGSIDGDSPAAMRYCLTGDTLILTTKGILPLNQISSKKEAKINFEILNYQGQRKKAVKFFNSGKHEIIKVTTEQGYNLKGSWNHPLLCWSLNEFNTPSLCWKMLKDISTEDYVLLNRNFSLFSPRNPSLIKCIPFFSKREKVVALPPKINKRLAFLLGALIAEGSFHQKKILFNNKDLGFYKKVKECIFENFPEINLSERDLKGDCKELEVYNQRAVRFLLNLGLKEVKSDAKEIPFIILQSRKEIIKEFLVGLFEGDGSIQLVKNKKPRGQSMQLTYDSKSTKLLGQLKTVLLNFGIITSKIYPDHRNGCYRLVIHGARNIELFKNEIGLFSERKNNLLASVKDLNKSRMSKVDFIPFLNIYFKKNYPHDFFKKYNFDRYHKLDKKYSFLLKFLKPSDQKLVDWLLAKKYFFNKIASVEKLPKEEVFSLKVDSSCHSFVANGFINHNTEAKLQKISAEMLQDIEKNTVLFKDNFDASLKEPQVLPAIVPNLLINGSSGIAVGMATNIPPHNLKEVCEGIIAVIDHPEISAQELNRIIPGPDFPTGGEVICGSALQYAYAKGKGKILIKAVTSVENEKIIVKEIPYQINKEELIHQIADLVRDKIISGIKNINDESDREGIRIVIDLKKDADPQVVLNQLFKFSRLKVTFGLNLLALVEDQPVLLSLKEIITHHLDHRRKVIFNRTQFDLEQAQKRIHLVEGLLVAIAHIEEVIPGIKKSRTVEDAKAYLMDAYALSELQARAILEMRLQKLASLEQEKLKEEHQELISQIKLFQEILGSEQKVLSLIKAELMDLKEKYGDPRRSKIISGDDNELDLEELIAEETVVVTMTNSGYLKRMPLDIYKTQRRGGKGMKAAGIKEEDFIERLYIASTHDYLLFFTDQGQLYWLKVYLLPEASRQAKGKHLANLLEMKPEEKITAIIPVKDFKGGHLFMATQKGIVKKTELREFSRPRKGGIRAITLDEDDTLVGVKYTEGNSEIILATRLGFANRFNENAVRPVGRAARGVIGIRLNPKDKVIGMLSAEQNLSILTLTENGYGKRTPLVEYRLCNRGGKGVTNMKIVEKNGLVKAVMLVDSREEIMLVSKQGIGIRIKSSEIPVIGRITQGVKIMKLNAGDRLAAAAKIVLEEEDFLKE